MQALELMDASLVGRLHANARVLREALGVQVSDMPIVPLLVGDADDAMALCETALEEGVFVQAIRPPTVPDGTSRLRAVATAAHDPTALAMLRENTMSYRVRGREVVPTGGVRQHGQ